MEVILWGSNGFSIRLSGGKEDFGCVPDGELGPVCLGLVLAPLESPLPASGLVQPRGSGMGCRERLGGSR